MDSGFLFARKKDLLLSSHALKNLRSRRSDRLRDLLGAGAPSEHGGVILQRPNDRMRFEERERLLLGNLPIQ